MSLIYWYHHNLDLTKTKTEVEENLCDRLMPMMFLLLYVGCHSTVSKKSDNSCPTGLVSIPQNHPMFCIHPFEGFIDSEEIVVSKMGQIPSINVSLEEAMSACKATTIDGQTLRLASLQEWQDAGDGQPGDGGLPYPWGGEKDDARCVIDSPINPNQWSTVQPAGSLKRCVSDSGVYDQIGNAWEWVDLRQTATRVDWTSLVNQQDFKVSVSVDSIEMETRLLPRLRLQTICVDMKRMALESGILTVQLNQDISSDCESGGRGYLWFNNSDPRHEKVQVPEQGSLLPIRIQDRKIVWDSDRDGESVGAKVGGSFYSGAQMTLQDFWIGHIPSFNGSIGFRCSSALLE